jgi:hypothetical protein
MSIIHLLLSVAMAEGHLVNQSQTDLYCYNSVKGESRCMARTVIRPGETCDGDAMGTDKYVFKIPDTARYLCSGSHCAPASAYSYGIMRLGILKKGREHYGEMSYEAFEKIMHKYAICPSEDTTPTDAGTAQ